MLHADDFLLISKAAVERFQKSSTGFRDFLDRFRAPGGPVRQFPNGAIEIHEVGVGTVEGEHPLDSCLSNDPEYGLEGKGFFRTLAPFQPKRFYSIQYPVDYQERLRSEDSFHAGDGVRVPPASGEFELAALRVAVIFRTRLTNHVRRAFADAVAVWGQTALKHGAFDDGPARLVSPGVTFQGTRAQFSIDASRSGQDTLNWLSLVILDFGYEFQPITYVRAGRTDAELDTMFGPAKGAPALIAFLGAHTGPAPLPEIAESPVTHVPLEAVTESSFPSKSFRVLTMPVDEWDRFVATVYFGRIPAADERQSFVELIRAWHCLSSYGGFGGSGTHSADEVAFDDAADSAIIRSDMGDTNPAIALAVLIRSLEGFQAGVGTPIDAVVFGTLI